MNVSANFQNKGAMLLMVKMKTLLFISKLQKVAAYLNLMEALPQTELTPLLIHKGLINCSNLVKVVGLRNDSPAVGDLGTQSNAKVNSQENIPVSSVCEGWKKKMMSHNFPELAGIGTELHVATQDYCIYGLHRQVVTSQR